jgi:DNA-binding XRE family transcriptional regulator
MKKITKRNVKDLPSISSFIREQEKDPEMKVLMDRAALRIEIARTIKTAREKAGLTQAELAKELGKTQAQIGRLESLSDKRLPSLELLAEIAAVTKRRLVVDRPGIHFELVAT